MTLKKFTLAKHNLNLTVYLIYLTLFVLIRDGGIATSGGNAVSLLGSFPLDVTDLRLSLIVTLR